MFLNGFQCIVYTSGMYSIDKFVKNNFKVQEIDLNIIESQNDLQDQIANFYNHNDKDILIVEINLKFPTNIKERIDLTIQLLNEARQASLNQLKNMFL